MSKSREKIAVGLRLRNDSLELLHWVITTTARPDDHVIALHYLDQSSSTVTAAGKGEKDAAGQKLKVDDARAALLSLLEPYRDLCSARKIKVKVSIVVGESLEQALVESAVSLQATTLVLGTSGGNRKPWRQTPGSYCSRHAPPGCAVLVVRNKKVLLHKESVAKASSVAAAAAAGTTTLPHEDTQYSSVQQGCGGPNSSASLCAFPKHFLCSAGPLADDQAGPIDGAIWECQPVNASNDTVAAAAATRVRCRQEVPKGEKGGGKCSPRAVFEGPGSSRTTDSEGSSPTSSSHCEESNEWSSTLASRTGLLIGSTPNEDEADRASVSVPQQKQGKPSLWKSFSHKRWQSFPSSYRKKNMVISDPILVTPDSSSIELLEIDHEGDVDDASSLLQAAANAKRSWQTFSYKELALATNDFHPENIVGKGGYAKVFKGILPCGRLIAVKKHNRGDASAEKEHDFLIELGIISHVSHPNTATLLGICIENGLHLVFQFSQHGSLQGLLHNPTRGLVLDWGVRYKVAVGVAHGLHYLHESCQRRIIHRDIKASNILLGPDFEPQISDFGLAKWLPDRWTHHTVSPVEGTIGYLAPEYFMHGIVDEKTDVFSYGVLLLELITGRRPVDSDKQNLVLWRAVLTASLCVRQSAVWRPCMSQVLQLLVDEPADTGKAERLSRLVSKSHDFQFSHEEPEEDYGCTDTYQNDMQRHRALLALEIE
ncbi:hypothetical protein BDL97_06G070100 [Sphagnum fallax]|nr:hypothetical protein BDL97_06G070100 [Sphagnum fallax]